jgi:hypothetical protein
MAKEEHKMNALPTQEMGHAAEKSSDHAMEKRALSALALGAVLGGAGGLCSQWIGETPLLCIALQSAFSMIVFGITALARPMDLTLDTQSLEMCPAIEASRPYERQDPCGQRIEARLGFAAS